MIILEDVRIVLPAVRANARMTQQEWALSIGVDKSTVYNWESGKTEPTSTQLRKMSELSHIPIDLIFVQKQS